METRFTRDNSEIRSWTVYTGNYLVGSVEETADQKLVFTSDPDTSLSADALTEIAAFIRQQSGEDAPAAADSTLEKRVAELEKRVVSNKGFDKNTKDIERLCDTADAMANCIVNWYTIAAGIVAESGFVTLNADGDPVGRDPKIDRVIAKVRAMLPRKQNG